MALIGASPIFGNRMPREADLRLDIRSFLATSNRSRVYETMAGLNRNARLLGTIFTASLIVALCLSRQCEG